jgi:hypothetical protein
VIFSVAALALLDVLTIEALLPSRGIAFFSGREQPNSLDLIFRTERPNSLDLFL